MTQLGNIYDGLDSGVEGESPGELSGEDLHVAVEVPRAALGADVAFEVDVPLTLVGLRRADPHGEGSRVPLHLPKDLPDGATLRLRGLGALGPRAKQDATQRAGDLYVIITLTDAPWHHPQATSGGSRQLIIAIVFIVIVAMILWAVVFR